MVVVVCVEEALLDIGEKGTSLEENVGFAAFKDNGRRRRRAVQGLMCLVSGDIAGSVNKVWEWDLMHIRFMIVAVRFDVDPVEIDWEGGGNMMYLTYQFSIFIHDIFERVGWTMVKATNESEVVNIG